MNSEQNPFDIVVDVYLRSVMAYVATLHQRMLKYLGPAHSLVFVDDQAPSNEVLGVFAYLGIIGES